MSPWLKPAQQSPTPHYPDPTILHIALNTLISSQIYGWLLITSLTTAVAVDKFEGQPTRGYTAKEQGDREKTEEARGTVWNAREKTEMCRSLTEHHCFKANASLHPLPVMFEFMPFVSSFFPPCGLWGYGDRECIKVINTGCKFVKVQHLIMWLRWRTFSSQRHWELHYWFLFNIVVLSLSAVIMWWFSFRGTMF